MWTDFEKRNSNLCGDAADFTLPPPHLGHDCMQSNVWNVPIQSPELAAPPKKYANAEKSSWSTSLKNSQTTGKNDSVSLFHQQPIINLHV